MPRVRPRAGTRRAPASAGPAVVIPYNPGGDRGRDTPLACLPACLPTTTWLRHIACDYMAETSSEHEGADGHRLDKPSTGNQRSKMSTDTSHAQKGAESAECIRIHGGVLSTLVATNRCIGSRPSIVGATIPIGLLGLPYVCNLTAATVDSAAIRCRICATLRGAYDCVVRACVRTAVPPGRPAPDRLRRYT